MYAKEIKDQSLHDCHQTSTFVWSRMLDSWKGGGTDSRETDMKMLRRIKGVTLRDSKERGHQKGATCEQHTRESKRNETMLVWTHAENGRKQRSESSW